MRQQESRKFPILILLVSGTLLIISVIVIIMRNNTGQATPTVPVINGGHKEETYPEINRVSLAEAKTALEAGSAVFVDVRIAGAYNVDHIPGALNIPLGEIEARLAELDPSQWIITYCT